jgi:hypothetical protein
MKFDCVAENFMFGGAPRKRVRYALGLDMPGPATTRIVGNPPQPLSQYELSGYCDYRLEHTERGHLIGLQYGGPEVPENLVAMYAGYNGAAGAWGIMERELAAHLAIRGNRVNLNVHCCYPDATTAIPDRIEIIVQHVAGAPVPHNFQHLRTLMQPPCIALQDPLTRPDAELRNNLEAEWKQMVLAKWYVESLGLTIGIRNIPLEVGCIAPGNVNWTKPAHVFAFYKARPYAVLDWLWFTRREQYFAMGLPAPGTISNTTGFSESQRSIIRKCNILFHEGWLTSDLWGITNRERYQHLIMASTDAQAQIDHISGRSGSGSNAFSNARVISADLNKTLNDARESGIVQRQIEAQFV